MLAARARRPEYLAAEAVTVLCCESLIAQCEVLRRGEAFFLGRVLMPGHVVHGPPVHLLLWDMWDLAMW